MNSKEGGSREVGCSGSVKCGLWEIEQYEEGFKML